MRKLIITIVVISFGMIVFGFGNCRSKMQENSSVKQTETNRPLVTDKSSPENVSSIDAEKWTKSCKEGKRKILSVINEIDKLRIIRLKKGEDISLKEAEEIEKNIIKLVDGIGNNPNDILTFAKLSRDLMQHCFDDGGEYQIAFFQSVKILVKNHNDDSWVQEQLKILKNTSNLNETDAGEFEAILKGQSFP